MVDAEQRAQHGQSLTIHESVDRDIDTDQTTMAARKTTTLQTDEPELLGESLMQGGYEHHMCTLVAKIFKCTSGNEEATAPPPRHRSTDSSTAWRRLISDRTRARRMREIYIPGRDDPPEEDLMEWDMAYYDANVLLKIAAGYACNGQGIPFLELGVHRPADRRTVGAREVVVTFKPCSEESMTSLIYLLHYWETTTVGAGSWSTGMLTCLTNWVCARPGVQREAVDRVFADVASVEVPDCIPNKHTRALVIGSLLDNSSSRILKLEDALNSSPEHTCCSRQGRPSIEVRVMNMDTGRMEMYSGGNYVCLSYVWQQWDDEQLRQQLMLCRGALPCQRIWCDRWSIRQSDSADVAFWVSQMDAIYERARQVVVLIGEYGGECMSRPSPQAIHARNEIERWEPAIGAWKRSQWKSRVWTMQEGMLAGDAQVFFRGEAKGWSALELAAASSMSVTRGQPYCDKAYRVRAVGEDAVIDPVGEFGRIRQRCDECGVSADAEGVKMPLAMLIGQAMKRKCEFPGDMVNGVGALANIKVPMMPKDWTLKKCLKALLEGGHIGAECMALGIGNKGKGQSWLPADTSVGENRHFPDTIAAHTKGSLLSVRAKLARCKCIVEIHRSKFLEVDIHKVVDFECTVCGATLTGATDNSWEGESGGIYDLVLNKTGGLVVTTTKIKDGTAQVTHCRSVKLEGCEACKCSEDRLYG